MKLIDSKGKIFGLINYLDLIVLLIVVLLAGKFLILDNDENSKELLNVQDDKEILLTYYIGSVRDVSINSVNEGDIFRDVDSKNVLGEVVKKEVENSQIQTTDSDGNIIYSTVPDRYDMKLTIKSRGKVTESDIKASNVEVQVGRLMPIESKMNRFEAVVFGIKY